MAELQPGGFYSGYLTMAEGMGGVNDRAARLNQFLQDAPTESARKQAELEAQRFQNQNAMTMMQAKMQGSPFEQLKHADELALKKQELEKQYALLNNTIRHQTLQEQNAAEAAKRLATQPVWDADSSTWRYPPGGSRLSPTSQGAGSAAAGAVGAVSGGMPTEDEPILSHKKVEEARQLRTEMMKHIEPLNALESDIAQTRQLLKLGTPLAHEKINEKLLSLLDPNRTSSQLLYRNQQFGDLLERAIGHVGKFFTGRYTDEQQKSIQNLVDEMQSRVVSPAKERIGNYYKGMAKQARIPENQMQSPDFYGSTPTTAPQSDKLEFRGYRFPSQAALNKYKKDNGLE